MNQLVYSGTMGILRRDRRLAYLAAVLVPGLVTLICLPLGPGEGIWPALATLYTAGVVFIAVWVGWPPAMVSLVESALLLDYFFVGPTDNFSIPNRDDVEIFVSFILLGITVAVLIGWRRANEKRLDIALALTRAQAELNQARSASDLTDLSAETGQLLQWVATIAQVHGGVATTIEQLADRLAAAGADDPGEWAELAGELRTEAARLRGSSESPN
jgi:two-component system sensor histidine kinase KdpD